MDFVTKAIIARKLLLKQKKCLRLPSLAPSFTLLASLNLLDELVESCDLCRESHLALQVQSSRCVGRELKNDNEFLAPPPSAILYVASEVSTGGLEVLPVLQKNHLSPQFVLEAP